MFVFSARIFQPPGQQAIMILRGIDCSALIPVVPNVFGWFYVSIDGRKNKKMQWNAEVRSIFSFSVFQF
jgi:hypothetical protein